ncbi:MAG TPA: hypothetical protein VFS21_07835 [Roseiflexaceae bacterium]|nr:hypothetical protein [Roseiflexaceae bacterium]
MKLRFSVDGLPPKKDGANSMWRQPDLVERLIALRTRAREAMGNLPPQASSFHLRVRVEALREEGDLDNFITGICDGLMAAKGNWWHDSPRWAEQLAAIRPDQHIAYTDDRWIDRIEAERVAPEGSQRVYTVELVWL